MDPLATFFLTVVFGFLGFFVLWLVVRSAVKWGIIRAAHFMRKEGIRFPVAASAPKRPAATAPENRPSN